MVNVKIPEIEGLDAAAAAGILSRAALALDSEGANPAARPRDEKEEEIRNHLIKRLFKEFGGGGDDAKRLVLEFLDNEADEIGGIGDIDSAVERLSAEAALPSDLYEIELSDDVLKLSLPVDDRPLVRKTVIHSDYTQDFGPKVSPNDPSFISLYGKWYEPGKVLDRFLLLVAGSRRDGTLRVHHAWRVYPVYVSLAGASTLVDVLRRFSDVYGVVFSAGPWTGKFLYHALIECPPRKFPLGIVERGNFEVHTSVFVKAISDNIVEATFGISVNLTRYRRDLNKHVQRLRTRMKG